MKITVCELSQEENDFASYWERLLSHAKTEKSDLVLLPEMAFSSWFALNRTFDPAVWEAAIDSHDQWQSRFQDLAPAMILGSRPVNRDGKRLNEAFAWDMETGYHATHSKRYLPDEEGFWEASWYEQGEGRFKPIEIRGMKIGFMICTDIWFYQHARAYGKSGVHIIAHPRATQRANLDKWLVAGRAASVVSGAFCISSNHVNPRGHKPNLGGMGWITGTDGDVLGLTSTKDPIVTKGIDLTEAERAKQTYPRYIKD